MRLLVMLLFVAALAVFLWSALQYLLSRFARPLDLHRREHDRIQDRLSDLEQRAEDPARERDPSR